MSRKGKARRTALTLPLVLAAAFLNAARAAPPQPGAGEEPPIDTLFVTGHPAEVFGAVAETHHGVGPDRIGTLRPFSAADIVGDLPAAHLTTNSRGETLVYLRNAAERQVAVYFDGALLNVPWDNRYDLRLLPAGAIARADSAAGPPSPQYGVNALGAVGFTGISGEGSGASGRLDLFGGSQGRRGAQALLSGGSGAFSATAAGGAYGMDGDALAEEAALPFFQAEDAVRTNTDIEAENLYLRGAYELGEASLSATLLYADAQRGIAPESDRGAGNRFWRYPEARTVMGIVGADLAAGERSALSATGWVQDFQQTIDSYESAAFSVIEDREESRDRTYGSRAILQSDLGPVWLTTSVNFLHSTHRQRDIEFTDATLPTALPNALRYSQNTASFGIDAEYFLSDRLTLIGSAGVDWAGYQATGGKPGMDPFAAPVFRLAGAYEATDSLRLRLSFGRKSRMPTMRELFGQAIGRFLINPDLEPEKVFTAEAGADVVGERGRMEVVIFGTQVADTIDQRFVGSLRQRINLPESYVLGTEVTGHYDLTSSLRLGGDLMLTRARRRTEEDEPFVFALERPSFIGRLHASYTAPGGARIGAELDHIGKSFSAGPEGDVVRLDRSTQVNLHAAYPIGAADGARGAEVYVRGTNLTDTLVELQAGLPAPGRAVWGGIELRF